MRQAVDPKSSPISRVVGPLVRDDDVVAFAYRDATAQVRHRCQPLPLDLVAMDRGIVRRLGIDSAIAEAVAHLTREGGPRGFWIHVDVDVLDQSIMVLAITNSAVS